jgi:hypothetical protein
MMFSGSTRRAFYLNAKRRSTLIELLIVQLAITPRPQAAK